MPSSLSETGHRLRAAVEVRVISLAFEMTIVSERCRVIQCAKEKSLPGPINVTEQAFKMIAAAWQIKYSLVLLRSLNATVVS